VNLVDELHAIAAALAAVAVPHAVCGGLLLDLLIAEAAFPLHRAVPD
jgi:hypothetical protein